MFVHHPLIILISVSDLIKRGTVSDLIKRGTVSNLIKRGTVSDLIKRGTGINLIKRGMGVGPIGRPAAGKILGATGRKIPGKIQRKNSRQWLTSEASGWDRAADLWQGHW